MKTKSILTSLFLSLILISCNKKEESQENEAVKDNFSVVIEGVFAKNDKLQVYYLTGGKAWTEENSVFRPVYGSNEMQTIEIDLPKAVKPENIRVDLGFNTTQSNVTIKNISVKYKSKEIDGDMDNFNRYFFPNQYIAWDADYFGLKLIKINNSYDPYLTGNDLLIGKLKKMKE